MNAPRPDPALGAGKRRVTAVLSHGERIALELAAEPNEDGFRELTWPGHPLFVMLALPAEDDGSLAKVAADFIEEIDRRSPRRFWRGDGGGAV